uniref:DUF4831 family protein n=1 Tax=Prevotella sp. GTC17259 TaxID=3236795 RepID=A0AB33J7P0_9BACT
MNIWKILLSAALVLESANLQAQQPVEGTTYFLPKTAIKFNLLIEKTTVTPGQLALYADKYMRLRNVPQKPSTAYRLVSVNMRSVGIPDSAKQFTLQMDKKHIIYSVNRDENGVLLAVNAQPLKKQAYKPFKAARKPTLPDAHNYMTEDILAAGSSAKMAELIAREIYDIRDSRSQLSRGEAEFMPKDGEQLKLMFENLDTQEHALMQMFEGTTQKDTVETELTFVPEKEADKQLLFRFSKKLGMVDLDDLAGAPYLIKIEDLHDIATVQLGVENEKKSKDDIGLNVNLPGRIRITLFKADEQWASFELYAAQFGRMEKISGEMFGKKINTNLVLNGITGNVESIRMQPQ